MSFGVATDGWSAVIVGNAIVREYNVMIQNERHHRAFPPTPLKLVDKLAKMVGASRFQPFALFLSRSTHNPLQRDQIPIIVRTHKSLVVVSEKLGGCDPARVEVACNLLQFLGLHVENEHRYGFHNVADEQAVATDCDFDGNDVATMGGHWNEFR